MNELGAQQTPTSGKNVDAWILKGVCFPAGTEFRAKYKRKVYVGRIEEGALLVLGKRFRSPSAAAVEITKRATNGWIFWECKLPGAETWVPISALRN